MKEYKAGKVEFRNDNGGIVHAVVGKISFDAPKLTDNIQAFIDFVLHLKPHSVEGQYVKSVAVCATMSPVGADRNLRVKARESVSANVRPCSFGTLDIGAHNHEQTSQRPDRRGSASG